MHGLEIGQVIELERKQGYDETEQGGRGRRILVKEKYIIVQICKNQIIVQSRDGFKRGVTIGELIVRGIIRQSGQYEELCAESQDEEISQKRGKYSRKK